jgi:hypothetical protein
MTSPSRRRALGSILTAATAIAAGATAIIALPTSADAELLGLGPNLETIYAAFEAALREHSAVQQIYFDRCQPRPLFDKEAHIGLDGKGQRENNRRWHDIIRAHEADDRRLRLETKVDDLELASDHLSDDFTNALGSVAELKATTIAGLKFKTRWAEHDEEVKDSLIRDVLDFKIAREETANA